MKHGKYIFLYCFLFFSFCQVLADDSKIEEIEKESYSKYQYRVEQVCEQYRDNEVVYNTKNYKEAGAYTDSGLDEDPFIVGNQDKDIIKSVVANYKENMNSIYNCAMIGVQKNSIELTKTQLFAMDKTGDLQKLFEPKVDKILQRLQEYSRRLDCQNIDKKTIYNKLSILRQTTYETCRYGFYMEYLKDYYGIPKNALKEELSEDGSSVSSMKAGYILSNLELSLNQEVEQAYKTFPIAYHAYSEYENNFPIHFLLQVIKEDFYILRNKLYQVLNPINQVVYKISNAMSK